MNDEAVLIAKVAGLLKSFESLKASNSIGKYTSYQVEHLISQYYNIVSLTRQVMPDLYSDLPDLPKPSRASNGFYEYRSIGPLRDLLEYIVEVRTTHRAIHIKQEDMRPNRIFISHGRSQDWRTLQSHIEKVLKKDTLELAQEPNMGFTVLQKLDDASNRCGYAIIVMTGDDVHGEEVRARENVMHEIGFFQGKYGLRNVILLHEDGVSIPSNMQGIVYIPFPKGMIHATFGAIQNDLQAIMQ